MALVCCRHRRWPYEVEGSSLANGLAESVHFFGETSIWFSPPTASVLFSLCPAIFQHLAVNRWPVKGLALPIFSCGLGQPSLHGRGHTDFIQDGFNGWSLMNSESLAALLRLLAMNPHLVSSCGENALLTARVFFVWIFSCKSNYLCCHIVCGFFGSVGIHLPSSRKHNILQHLNTRGPTSSGFSSFSFRGRILTFLHSRLATQDLTDYSNQTFFEAFGLSIIYNGEIYNLSFLRSILSSYTDLFIRYRAYSLSLSFFGHWMFPLSLVYLPCNIDHNKDQIILARDRLGIKLLLSCFLFRFEFGSTVQSLSWDKLFHMTIFLNLRLPAMHFGDLLMHLSQSIHT